MTPICVDHRRAGEHGHVGAINDTRALPNDLSFLLAGSRVSKGKDLVLVEPGRAKGAYTCRCVWSIGCWNASFDQSIAGRKGFRFVQIICVDRDEQAGWDARGGFGKNTTTSYSEY